jgi:hypothetical protein
MNAASKSNILGSCLHLRRVGCCGCPNKETCFSTHTHNTISMNDFDGDEFSCFSGSNFAAFGADFDGDERSLELEQPVCANCKSLVPRRRCRHCLVTYFCSRSCERKVRKTHEGWCLSFGRMYLRHQQALSRLLLLLTSLPTVCIHLIVKDYSAREFALYSATQERDGIPVVSYNCQQGDMVKVTQVVSEQGFEDWLQGQRDSKDWIFRGVVEPARGTSWLRLNVPKLTHTTYKRVDYGNVEPDPKGPPARPDVSCFHEEKKKKREKEKWSCLSFE